MCLLQNRQRWASAGFILQLTSLGGQKPVPKYKEHKSHSTSNIWRTIRSMGNAVGVLVWRAVWGRFV
ncbi:hypothetical protein FR483_n258L [Paramecium bursaria Chlorella virus FR483]|uniref:Uncharacterized protein n258L n=1 Tax=Paramecium bursaria Chlorella virus FR483 TaxID=399781 RepID=A7J6W2_PBCVF|nr:hypothetical protein FR483_n258L [Paramecium bursaria Chlorella virus FR483]ABT15543.1 hypothetical protein FR483_n258L [Paramecium bursaria Chlorella virus FR483]